MDYHIVIPLTTGGYFSGNRSECLDFLSKCPHLVLNKASLGAYFHWSKSQEKYIDIESMHPNYVCNVLLKQLDIVPAMGGYTFIRHLLSTNTLPYDKVASMVRSWYELWQLEWDVDTDALLNRLQDVYEEDTNEEVILF
jgi:hypothetical protein